MTKTRSPLLPYLSVRSPFTLSILFFALVSVGQLFAAENCPTVDAKKSLLVTDLSITDSALAEPEGLFGFSFMARHIFGPNQDSTEAMRQWFLTWTHNSIDGISLLSRSPGLILGLWPTLPSGEIDLAKAPFRLMAIVYRPDLVSPSAPFGEFRFVYNAYHPNTGVPIDLTIIFEFALPRRQSAVLWSSEIASLSALTGQSYVNALSAIVTEVTALPENLGQVRTNDFYLGPEWEMREFRRNFSGGLTPVPLNQTPALELNNIDQGEFVDWLLANAESVISKTYQLPKRFQAASAIAFDDSFRWFPNSQVLSDDLRQKLSISTCNGCHTGETGSRFQHLLPRREGFEAEASAFMVRDVAKRQRILEDAVCPSVNIAQRSVH